MNLQTKWKYFGLQHQVWKHEILFYLWFAMWRILGW